MDYYAIGQKIRKVRKARGLSQEQLAEKAGISTTHMSHIETANTKLSLPVFAEICGVLEVRADELLFEQPLSCRSAATEEILGILENCSSAQLLVIEDIVKAAAISLNTHL